MIVMSSFSNSNSFSCALWCSIQVIIHNYTCILIHFPSGGKFPRPFELNTDIVTWTRLLTRADKSTADSSDHLSHEGKEDRTKHKTPTGVPDGSPPLSPLTTSGDSTPKSPLTPPQSVASGMVEGLLCVCLFLSLSPSSSSSPSPSPSSSPSSSPSPSPSPSLPLSHFNGFFFQL